MEETSTAKSNEFNSMELNSKSVGHLNEARKWSFFLSIMGFIGVGFMVLAALLVSVIFSFISDSTLSTGLGIGISVLYLIIAALYFFPVYFLFNFSTKAKKAVQSGDSNILTESIRNLKSHYKFVGIMTIIMLVIYPVIIMIAILAGVLTNLH